MQSFKQKILRPAFVFLLCLVMTLGISGLSVFAAGENEDPVSKIVDGMSLDEKISQMIIPAIRSWNGTNVTDLDAVPALADALQKHQYGGVILFKQNVSGTEQLARLVSALQVNNAGIKEVSTNIPYMIPIDEEGGTVLRISSGTRMTGNMAIGATGENALKNAEITGQIIGEEMKALGLNVNFAPVIDVNNNPANPVIGTRSFSDDPTAVGPLGMAYANGLSKSNIVAAFKHFPGHGDTGEDTHIETAAVDKAYDQMQQNELLPFQHVIDNGAEMIMTAHITLPQIDDLVTFADGTQGCYPATMSKKIMTDILRNEMGYKGVVVTDALEMDVITNTHLVEGEPNSAEYGANIAEKVINAGVDILLLPTDLNGTDGTVKTNKIAWYDDYISMLIEKVEAGSISEARIDESVTRILELKQKNGILDMDTSGENIESVVENAKKIVGSEANHEQEMKIAKEAITLVKNDKLALPLSGHEKNLVFIGRQKGDDVAILYSIHKLMEEGLIDKDAYIINLASGTQEGFAESETVITIDYYFDSASAPYRYSDALKSAVGNADSVVVFTKTSNLSALADSNVQYQAVSTFINDTHKAGGKCTLLSDNLPYDSARYQDADAIVLAYMGTGLDMDPTSSGDDGTLPAYNANIIAAIELMFDNVIPKGTLPVNIFAIDKTEDGSLFYTDKILYPRGFGEKFTYAFTEGTDSEYTEGSEGGLVFKNNARCDKLLKLLVDGTEVPKEAYTASAGSTNLAIVPAYLDTLSEGSHDLTAVYDYGEGAFSVESKFTVKKTTITPGDSDLGQASVVTTVSKGKINSSAKEKGKDPETGDRNNSLLWIVLMLAGLAGISGAVLYRMNSKQKKNGNR